MKTAKLFIALIPAGVISAPNAQAQVRITEWMYTGAPGEFIEFTNLGPAAIDLTGWSFDDNSRLPGSVNLTALGNVNPGESVVITEATATTFRSAWSLALTVKVLGGVVDNIGRSDEINLYDSANTLVDRLTYGDEVFAGTIRTQNISGRPNGPASIGVNNPALWSLSSVGDIENSYANLSGVVGSPGTSIAAVPEPGVYGLMLAGLALVSSLARRRLG